MKTFVVSTLALAGTAHLITAEPARAEIPASGPVELTNAQMDQISAGAGPSGLPTDPSWGDLTREVAGRDLGQHASEEGVPRVGLANILNRGDLAATIAFIDNLGGGLP